MDTHIPYLALRSSPVKLRSIYAYHSESSQMPFDNKAGLALHVSFIHFLKFPKYQVHAKYYSGCLPWISQARILDKVAISFSRGSSRPRDRTCVSCTGRRNLYY